MKKTKHIIILLLLTVVHTGYSQNSLSKKELSFRETFSEALKFYMSQEYDNAKSNCYAALEYKKSDAVYFLLYKINKEENNNLQSLNALEAALELDPANSWYHYYLAQEYIELNMHKNALNELKASIKLDPNYKQAYEDIIYLAIRNKNYETALNYLNKYEEKFGITTKTINFKLELLRNNNDLAAYNSALEDYRRQGKITESSYYLKLTELYLYTNDTLAEKYVDRSLSIDSTNSSALIYKAYLLQSKRKYNQAMDYLLKINNYKGIYQRIKIILDTLEKHADVCKTIKLYQNFTELDNEAYNKYIQFLWSNLGFTQLESLLNLRIKKKNYAFDNFMTLAMIYVLQDKYDSLSNLIDLGMQIYPSKAEFYILKAYVEKNATDDNRNFNKYLLAASSLDFDNKFGNIIGLIDGSQFNYSHVNTFTLIIAIKVCNDNCLEIIDNSLSKSKPINLYISMLINKRKGNQNKADEILEYLEQNSLLNKDCNETN